MSTLSSINGPLTEEQEAAIESYKTSFKYLRAIGKGVGIFLIVWSFFIPARTEFAHPTLSLLQAGFYAIYGLLLLVPEHKFSAPNWKRFLIVFSLFTLVFVFIQVFDTLFQNYLAHQVHSKAFPPILQSILVFFTLLQMPTILFRKKPNLLI